MTLQDTNLNHANLVKEVVEGVQQAFLPSTSEDGTDDLLLQVANAATQSSQVVPQLVQQMQQMQALMMQMQEQLNSSPSQRVLIGNEDSNIVGHIDCVII